MCEECGCDNHKHKEPDKQTDSNSQKTFEINRSITEFNDKTAKQIKEFLSNKNILCINLMGSPGAGKTTIIENIAKHISTKDLFVIQGDLESDIDTTRLKNAGIRSYQINTHSGCHLNANMINSALYDINLENIKFLIIENVGNLVCPAGVNIGQHINIIVSSTAEGHDKPNKYPIIFHDANIVIISKYDLKKYVDFKEEHYIKTLKKLTPKASIIKTSSKIPESFKTVVKELTHERDHLIGHKHTH